MRRALCGTLFAILLLTPCAALLAAPEACAPLSQINFQEPPPFTTQSFAFDSGGVQLGGCLYKPFGAERFPVVVLVAGSGGEPSAADIYSAIHAKAFAKRGIGAFAFDKRGLGASGGVETGTNFVQRAEDSAAAIRFVRTLPSTRGIALWGISQAGWVEPQALRAGDGVQMVMLISPAGVNPFDQVAFYIRGLAHRLGLTDAGTYQAERLHRAVVRYYATGKGYREAQSMVDGLKAQPWFERFRTNDEWDEKIGPGGKLLDPEQLKKAWAEHPGDFEFYRASSTFADYASVYRRLDRPTLVVEGSGDSLVPVDDAVAAFRKAFRENRNPDVEIKIFDGAEHGIQDGPKVRPAYLEFLADWAAKRFASTQAR